tara:strand:+ start:715 stop:1446 length:732 start_codon:yes stop_codon:yes gene_type:complete
MARKTHKHYAEEFGVSERTFRDWLEQGAPYMNKPKMLTWLNNLQHKTRHVKAYLKKHRISPLPTKKDVLKSKDGQTIEDFRDHYSKELSIATRTNDQSQISFWADLYLKAAESIRRSEIHAAKLGVETGATLPRERVEQIICDMCYSGNACIQSVMTMICQHLSGLDDPVEIYDVLMPAIVGGRLFSGLDKVSKLSGTPGLPDWVIAAYQKEAGQYLGNPELLWPKEKKKKKTKTKTKKKETK